MSVFVAACLAAAAWVAVLAGADRRCRRLGRQPTLAEPPSRPAAPRRAATFDLVAAALESGLAPLPAVTVVASALPDELGAGLRRAAAMVDVTGTPAWRALVGDPEIGPLASAMARSEQSGAPVAELVRGIAEELRRTERAERMMRARRVGVQTAAPLGLCFLPAFFVVAVVPTVIGLVGDVL